MMISTKQPMSLRTAAIISGVILIIMAIVAGFTYGYIHGSLVVPSDINLTFYNISSSIMLFKVEIIGWVIVLLLDIIVAWSFYIFLNPINKALSLLASWLRLSYAALLGIAILNLLFVLIIIDHADSSLFLQHDQLLANMRLFLDGFVLMWSVGLIVFGGHLLVVGWLVLQTNTIPKVISVLLLLGGIGYIVIHLCKLLLIQQNIISTIELVFTLPLILGELGFGIWLLVKGGKVSISL